MGTDMHVAIEVKRDEYSYVAKTVAPKWNFIKAWTVDRCYDLFGCFGPYRRHWDNAVSTHYAEDLSYYLQMEKKERYCYGFHVVTPDLLKEKILGWTPRMSQEELEEYGVDGPPCIDEGWLFDEYVYRGDDVYSKDKLNYAIYKLMIKRYGKDRVRLVIYFDS